jgi:hypothetical protein
MAMNFFLHGRYVMGSPLNRAVVVAASVADLVLITAIVVFWPGHVGLSNQFFVLYYPVVFAFALVFPRVIEAAYTVLAMLAYATACFVLGTVLGNYYFRIQRDRLRRVSEGTPSALEELKTRLQPAGRRAHS